MKRAFDFFLSTVMILLLLPLLPFLALWIKTGSKGPVFYTQPRVGKDMRQFRILKFRTMREDAPEGVSLTLGDVDPRLTPQGRFMKKFKIDELPQLLNVWRGDMSFVGPRPEVKKYVDKYSVEQKRTLTVRPGITDPASVKYRNESQLLAKAENPEEFYINVIMPDKLDISLRYIDRMSMLEDARIICATIKAVTSKRNGIVL